MQQHVQEDRRGAAAWRARHAPAMGRQSRPVSLWRDGEGGPGGRCFVVFDPGIIQTVRPGASWTLIWAGAPAYTLRAT